MTKEENIQGIPEKEIRDSIKATTEKFVTASGMTVAEAKAYNESIKDDKTKKKVSTAPRICLENVHIALNNDVRFADRLCYNEVDMKVYKAMPFPWDKKSDTKLMPINDRYDVSQLQRIIQRDYNQKPDDIKKQYIATAMDSSFNPIKEILEGLEWDGKEHIRYLMPKYLGVDNDEYQYKVLRLIMLALIERQYRPGSKFDCVMALNGSQGIGKSTFCKLLAFDDDAYFTDALGDLTDKDTLQIVAGKRVIELGEMLSLRKTKELEGVKRFLSSSTDCFRPPYGHTYEDFPRQCIIIATTNDNDYLSDVTGSRRWLPVSCKAENIKDLMKIQTDEAYDDVMAGWTEAMHDWKELTHNGSQPLDLVKMSYELAPEAAKRAVSHEEENPYEGEIGQYLQMKINRYFSDMSQQPRVCCKEIAQCALGIQNPGRFEIKDIAKILDNKFPDWERKGKLQCGMYGVQRVWVPKDEILKQEKKEEEKKAEAQEPKKVEKSIPEPQEQYKIVDSDIML